MCVFRVSLEYFLSQPMDQCFPGIVNKTVCFSQQCLRCLLFTYYFFQLLSNHCRTVHTEEAVEELASSTVSVGAVADGKKRRGAVQCREVKNIFFMCDMSTNAGTKSQQEHKKAWPCSDSSCS